MIDPPSPIQRTSLPTIRPPGVRTVAFTCLITHRVVPSALQQVGEPGAFMGEKTTRLLVALPVEDVPFGGGDVEVSCQADRFGFLAPWFSPRGELFQHLVFHFLSSLRRGPAGEIKAANDNATGAGHDDSAFLIGAAQACFQHFNGRAGPNGGAAVARLFGGVPDHVPPGRIGPWCREIFRKRSNLLQQNDLRSDLLQDLRKSFLESASETVHIPRHQPHVGGIMRSD